MLFYHFSRFPKCAHVIMRVHSGKHENIKVHACKNGNLLNVGAKIMV